MSIIELNNYKIILASKSPRRQELLRQLGIDFVVAVNDWKEEYPAHLTGSGIAVYLAEAKALSYKELVTPLTVLITADTIVWCNDKVLHKPYDRNNAIQILKEISGNTHEVITGVSFLSAASQTSFFSSTKVTFTELSEMEIEYYIDNFRPYDKAGAYGIQEWIGLAACSHMEGSYFNVMGLPVEQVYHKLGDFIRKDLEKIRMV